METEAKLQDALNKGGGEQVAQAQAAAESQGAGTASSPIADTGATGTPR